MKKLLTSVVLLAAGASWAAGYGVDTHSARATGMATAVTASIDDPSAILYNPAGISQGTGLAFYLGDTLVLPAFNANVNGTSYPAIRQVVPPPHIYVTYGITDKLSVGLGLFSLYGLSIAWPDDFPGRFVTKSAALSTYTLNPEVAYRLGPVKLGAGVQVVRGTVDLVQSINYIDSEGQVEIGGGAWGVGGNAGVQVEIVPKVFWAGLSYRSAVSMAFKGAAHFSDTPDAFASQAKDQNVKTTITLPDSVTLGVSVFPIPQLRLGLDGQYTAWQRFHDLSINFDDPSLDQSQIKHWHSTISGHLGGELTLAGCIDVRAGVIYDPTPAPVETLGPDLPDSNRVNIALGVGFHKGGFRADLGYQYVIINKTTSTNPVFAATYSGMANVVGLSLGYQFR